MAESHPYLRTFVRLLGFLRPYKWSLAVSIVLAVGSQAAAVAIAFLTGDALESAVDAQSRSQLWTIALAILVVGAARALFMVGRRLISGRQALGVEYDLRDEIYAKLLRLSFGFYDRHQTGQLMSRATVDLQAVRFFLGYGLIFLFQHVLTVVGVTIVLFIVDWKLALAATAFTPLLVVLAYRYSRVSHPVLRDVQQRMADVATVSEENIVGVHVVKSFAQEESEAAKFGERTESLFRRSLDANRQRAIYVPLLSFLPLIAQATVLLYGGRMVASGELALDAFFAFNVLVLMLVMPLRMLGMWIGQAQRATASGERIFEVIDETEDVRNAPGAIALPPGEGRIAFEGVGFAYSEGRPVLDGVDLEIAPGQTIALIGHTGSGKTTLASLVPRLYDVTAGRITLDGADVRDLKLASLRRAIGVVAQDPFLFSATVRENIAFGAPGSDGRGRAARGPAGAGARLHRGAARRLRDDGRRARDHALRRAAPAHCDRPRAVLDPRVLILDDATASVDATTEARIRLGLREAMKGRTTLIVAHRLSTVALADEIVVLDHGRIAARGTQAELLAESPVFREIYEHGLLEREFAERVEAAGA